MSAVQTNSKPDSQSELAYFLNTKFTEVTLGLDNGLRIACKQWGDEHAQTRILCLHGWLDSAATWDRIAPLIISSRKLSVRLVCMDFSGHGKSSHRSPDASYSLEERVSEVFDVADALHWDKFVLLAHSMGAAVALLAAGALPKRIQKMILVDGVGPWPHPLSGPAIMEVALKKNGRLRSRQRRVYGTIEEAMHRYLANNPFMQENSARILLSRCTEEVEVYEVSSNQDGTKRPEMKKEVGFCYRHDPRLTGSSLRRFSHEDVLDFCKRVQCPVLAFVAVNPKRNEINERIGPVFVSRLKAMADASCKVVEGSHHLHLDQADLLYRDIVDFLSNPKSIKGYGHIPERVPLKHQSKL